MRKIKVFGIILFLFILNSLHSQSMDHNALLDKTGARLYWDPWQRKGIMIKGSNSVLFFADQPILIFNGSNLHFEGAIVYDNGTLKFSQDSSELIINHFLESGTRKSPRDFNVAAIILDPGHGGRDSGANSRFGLDGVLVPLKEKNLVLELALRLEEKLKNQYPDKKIILTRKNDVYPSLEERVDIANNFKLSRGEGIIYISIHGNASLNSQARGFEIWYLPEAYRRQIIDTDNTLDPVLNTLLEEEFTLESKRLAGFILENLEKTIGDSTMNRGLKEESWFVVRNAMMASVLIEAGFITNQEETTLLRNPLYLQKLTEGIYNGIMDFVDFFENRAD